MCEAIERKGGRAHILYTLDFPDRLGLTINPSGGGARLALHGPARMDLHSTCSSVWLRRTFFPTIPAVFEESDRTIIERECRKMRESFLELLCSDALWVNSLHGHNAGKPAQLVAALRCGFETPPTLVSNEPAEIMAFVQGAPGHVIYKTFNGLVPTTVVTGAMLAEPEILRWTPGIYQHYIAKDHELRVTMVGRRCFAVRIGSQGTVRGQIDWREAQRSPGGQPSDLILEPVQLPPRVERRCRRLLRSLGLAYGAIDLIVTPQGEYVFLEVNPAGQFLWIEAQVGLPVLDALSAMLIEGRIDYRWDSRSPAVRFDADLEKAAHAREEKACAEHNCEIRL
jgi:hypothetical protein